MLWLRRYPAVLKQVHSELDIRPSLRINEVQKRMSKVSGKLEDDSVLWERRIAFGNLVSDKFELLHVTATGYCKMW